MLTTQLRKHSALNDNGEFIEEKLKMLEQARLSGWGRSKVPRGVAEESHVDNVSIVHTVWVSCV